MNPLIRLTAFFLLLFPHSAFAAYTITFNSAPMHEDYIEGEERESKLVVEHNGIKHTYGLMMGSTLLLDGSAEGWALFSCPVELSGEAAASQLIRVRLANGKTEMLMDHVLHLLPIIPAGKLVGVREQKPLDTDGVNPRELFVLDITSDRRHTVTSGYWLPSDNDLDKEDGSDGWARLRAQWDALIQIKDNTLLYRKDPKEPFQAFKL